MFYCFITNVTDLILQHFQRLKRLDSPIKSGNDERNIERKAPAQKINPQFYVFCFSLDPLNP